MTASVLRGIDASIARYRELKRPGGRTPSESARLRSMSRNCAAATRSVTPLTLGLRRDRSGLAATSAPGRTLGGPDRDSPRCCGDAARRLPRAIREQCRQRSVQQLVLTRVADQLGTGGEQSLLLDVRAVRLDRADAEDQRLGDLAVGVIRARSDAAPRARGARDCRDAARRQAARRLGARPAPGSDTCARRPPARPPSSALCRRRP